LAPGEDVRTSGLESRRPDIKFQLVIAPVHRLEILALGTQLKVGLFRMLLTGMSRPFILRF
jgi:hypothetical protein